MDPTMIVILIAVGAIAMWLFTKWASKSNDQSSSPPTTTDTSTTTSLTETHEIEED